MEAPSNRIFTSTTLSLVGISKPCTAAWGVMAALPSAAGIFLSRVWVPLRVPFSTVKVGTTLCQTLAGSAPSKSSEKRSSFFLAIGSLGTVGNSAAQIVEMRRKERANKQRGFNRVIIAWSDLQ